MSQQVYLDRILGVEILDPDGHRVGHLHEVRVVQQADGEFVVTEYLVGVSGLLERLGVEVWRSHAGAHGYVVRWDQMDLTDPAHPKVRCPARELARWTQKG